MLTHDRGRLFHGEGAYLTCSVLFALMDLFKMFMYIYFHDWFDLSKKQGGRVLYIGWRENYARMCVFVSVC